MLRLMLMLAALVAAPPPDPASVRVAQPQPYELWDGRVRGTAPVGSTLVVVSRKRRWRVPVGADGRFDRVLPGVPRGDGEVTVGGHRVAAVFGVPSGSILPLPKPRADLDLNKRLRHLARMVTPHVSIYSRSWSGRAAAYNAGAEFEAASTLKLPIMLVALSDNHGELEHSKYWDPMVRVTRYSDNAAANELLEQTGGSDADGAADMVELMKSLADPHLHGRRLPDRRRRRIVTAGRCRPTAHRPQAHHRRRHGRAGRDAGRRRRRAGAAAPARHLAPRGPRAALPDGARTGPGPGPGRRPRAAGGAQDRLAGRRRQ